MILMRYCGGKAFGESAAISIHRVPVVCRSGSYTVSSLLVAFFFYKTYYKTVAGMLDGTFPERMVDLDFYAKYEEHPCPNIVYEVEELGNLINRLSENLERTISGVKKNCLT